MHGLTNRSIHIYTFNQGTTHITIGKGTLHPSVLIYHKEHQWFIVNLIDAANGINNRERLENNMRAIQIN